MSIVGSYDIHGITAGDEALVSLEHHSQGLDFALPAHNMEWVVLLSAMKSLELIARVTATA